MGAIRLKGADKSCASASCTKEMDQCLKAVKQVEQFQTKNLGEGVYKQIRSQKAARDVGRQSCTSCFTRPSHGEKGRDGSKPSTRKTAAATTRCYKSDLWDGGGGLPLGQFSCKTNGISSAVPGPGLMLPGFLLLFAPTLGCPSQVDAWGSPLPPPMHATGQRRILLARSLFGCKNRDVNVLNKIAEAALGGK